MFKLLRYLKGYVAVSVVAPLFKLMEALFELILPLVVAKIIDVGIPSGDISYVIKLGLVMVALGAAGLLFSATCQFLAAKASLGFGTNVRAAFYRHVNSLSYKELDKFGAPTLLTRLTGDINQTQVAVAMFIRLVMRAPFIVIGSIIMAISINAKISLIFILMAVVVSVALFIIMKLSVPLHRKAAYRQDDASLLIRENLSGTRVVRAFSRQTRANKDYADAADRLASTNIKAGAVSNVLNPLTFALVNLAVIAVLWFGGKTVFYGDLTQGEIIALVNYLMQIQLSLVVLANLIVMFTRAQACATRINEVFETGSSIVDTASTEVVGDKSAPIVEFKEVTFGYTSGGNALEKINLTIERGETVGIIGSTGSGKSTLVNLIPRFYDCNLGEVLIEGVCVKDYPLKQLRQKIGIVPQRASLVSGTLRSNLNWADGDTSDEQLHEAIKLAQAEDVLKRLGGLDGEIAQGGKNLSGGQKQRLTIARALVSKPEILILDDSSSALDFATDLKLRRALKRLKNVTVIIVSQRYNSVMDADKIAVMDEGEIEAVGKHNQLINDSKIYGEIVNSQAGLNGGAL